VNKECIYCEKNHYDNNPKINLIEQTYRDGSVLTTKLIEGTLHSHLDLNKQTSRGTTKYDYSSCKQINYCPMCGKKIIEGNE
jgi:hypothetical protein